MSFDYAVGGNPFVATVCDNNVTGSQVRCTTGSTSAPCYNKNGVITTTVDLLGRATSYIDVWGNTTTSDYFSDGRLWRTVGPTARSRSVTTPRVG